MKKSKSLRSSIASRLNFALISRKFVKNLILDLLAALLVIASWCVIVERQNTSEADSVSRRRFEVTDDFSSFGEDVARLVSDARAADVGEKMSDEEIESMKEQLPFSGIDYIFLVSRGESGEYDVVRVSAGVILTLVCVIFVLLFAFQLLSFIWGTVSGSGVIRKYLKPIDDIAIMAEKLSSDDNASRETIEAERLSHDDTDISSEELSSLAYAIDSIDDSCKRIEIHDTELGSLEAAVNNMLRRLEESKRKQIRFVDDASHELRTPISVIQGYANMLDRWGKNDPEIMDEAITAIKNESEHMKVLIDQLLFLARGEMDRVVFDKKELNACALMEEIYDESIMLEAELPEGERHEFYASELYENDELRRYMITADEAMMKQAVRILRDNALKYTPAGGQISFRVYARDDKVCLEVRDTGIGIPKGELPRIFDRFYRGSNARADNTSGSGLGLSIARWIVETHSGSIEAVSGSGFGTKMTIVV